MNEVAIQLPLLGLLCTSQSFSSKTIGSALDFATTVLSISAVLILMLSNKALKRSQVISLKSLIRGVFIVATVVGWGWSVVRLGAARAVLIDMILLVALTCLSEKKRDYGIFALCAASWAGTSLSSGMYIASIVAALSVVSREAFNLFRDAASLVVSAGVSFALSMIMHGFYPHSIASTTAPELSHRSTSASLTWAFASALLWIAPIALASSYEEKWSEYTLNKKNRVVLSLCCVVMIALVDRSLHVLSFFVAILGAVAVVVRRKIKAQRSFLPTTLGESVDTDGFKKSSMTPFVFLQRVSLSQVANFFREANSNKDSRKILQFLTLTLSFMFVEIFVGLYSGSLGLISDAGHMFFDSAALFIGLFAAFASRWRPDNVFTYGYSRYETIAGFVNAVFLTFVAVFVLTESLERFSEPPAIKTEGLLLTSVLGLVVNGIGLVFFHEHAHSHGGGDTGGHSHMGESHRDSSEDEDSEGSRAHTHSHSKASHSHSHESHGHSHESHHGHSHHHGSHSHSHESNHDHGSHSHSHGGQNGRKKTSDHGHSHANENMHGVFLHVLADALGSVGVIISSLLIQYKGWYIADPICSFCISVLIFLSVMPLLKSTANSLLLRVPSESERSFETCIERLRRKEGVVKVVRAHVWRLSKDDVIATANVVVANKDAGERILTWLTSALKNDVGATEVTVQVYTENAARDIR